ncbi:MAG: DNA double-strand break repair nuclease NurA [Candidatus Bathyarchaeia archaeon]
MLRTGEGEERRVHLQDVKSLLLSVRSMLLDEVTEDVVEEAPTIRSLAKRIRVEMEIYPLTKREPYSVVAGADAGSHILPLASRRYAVISALVYTLPGGDKFFLEPESLSEPYRSSEAGFRGNVNICREARLYETASEYIERRPETQLLLIDGPLLLNSWWGLSGDEFDRKRLLEGLNHLLRLGHERGITIAGVVKRPSARYLLYHLGLQEETDLPDSFLLLQALQPGERTDIFSPRVAMRAKSRGGFLNGLDTPIYSFFSRLSGDWSIPPIRIDLPVYSLASVDDVADYCYSTSFWAGIPLSIVKADEEVKIGKQFIADVYREIVSRVGRRTGDFGHVAPYWGEAGWMGA